MDMLLLMIGLILGGRSAVSLEPACTSRFDYDVKLLESYLELKQSYKTLTDTVHQLRADLDGQQAAVTELKDVSLQAQPAKVAFYVQLATDIKNVGDHQTFVFDMVTTNIGNGYSKIDGEFTAPVAGLYVFSWTHTNRDRSFMNSEFVKNNVVFGKAMSDAADHSDYAVASNTAILQIEKGDKIWIRSGTWHSRTVAGTQYSTFSGWLL